VVIAIVGFVRVRSDFNNFTLISFVLTQGFPKAPAVPNPVVIVAQASTPPVVTLDNEDWEEDCVKRSSAASGCSKNGSTFDVTQEEDWEAEPPACPADKPFYDPQLVLDKQHVFL